MSCCHYDEGYDDGLDAGRRGGIDNDTAFSDLLYEWASIQRDEDVRAAGLLVVEQMGSVDLEDLAHRVKTRQERMLVEYRAARV